jgi:hypothetical protein
LDTETTVDKIATLQPVIKTLGPEPDLPSACNEVDPARFWGSSTSGEGGAVDSLGPEYWLKGGPAYYEKFIPEIDGVIDPLESWQFGGIRNELQRGGMCNG